MPEAADTPAGPALRIDTDSLREAARAVRRTGPGVVSLSRERLQSPEKGGTPQRLSASMEDAIKPDCLHHNDAKSLQSGVTGLLALPLIAADAASGKCR